MFRPPDGSKNGQHEVSGGFDEPGSLIGGYLTPIDNRFQLVASRRDSGSLFRVEREFGRSLEHAIEQAMHGPRFIDVRVVARRPAWRRDSVCQALRDIGHPAANAR